VVISAAARAHIDERAKQRPLHDVSDDEIREALLLGDPPFEYKSHATIPGRFVFYGETNACRDIFVVADVVRGDDVDDIHVITAFEPDSGYAYFAEL
jgi:hypothetical protein